MADYPLDWGWHTDPKDDASPAKMPAAPKALLDAMRARIFSMFCAIRTLA